MVSSIDGCNTYGWLPQALGLGGRASRVRSGRHLKTPWLREVHLEVDAVLPENTSLNSAEASAFGRCKQIITIDNLKTSGHIGNYLQQVLQR